MRTLATRCVAALALAATVGCQEARVDPRAFDATPELLSSAVDELTGIMVGSITSPPVASRTYTYASIAAYEALRHDHAEYRSLAGQLPGLQPAPAPDAERQHLLPLSSVVAFLSVAEAMVFAPEKVAAYREGVIQQVREQGVPRSVVRRSVEYGEQVAQHVLAWAATDNLKHARSLPRFEVLSDSARWRPTPPAYMDGVEPNWAVLRPFTMDSASQFRPPPPLPYDMREGSPFREQVLAVYEAGQALTDEQRLIASFWDCNPFAMKAEGHFMFSVKKITPGGHWMGIAGIALDSVDANLMRAAETYAKVGMAVADGFISTWDEKYRSVLVRPETLINAQISREWRPVLQTPPFPEYPSGHSVISIAAAEVLTGLFGDDFAYDDDVEVEYGLPVRSFPSFRAAASEAAISRLYGGIHYPMAIDHGVEQGRALGQNLLARVATREPMLTATTP